MDKSFDPNGIEPRWYETWETNGYFRPSGVGEPYCIMLPPPNVTGRLHMGHAFQDTIMDTLIRYHRMCGHNTLWQGGTDHAGIATQMLVERQLANDGKSRHDLGREKFVEAVWDWKEESDDVINRQLRRLGCSLDWGTARFTMDEGMSNAVMREFIELYREGLIYRGKRLVNWDPVLHTALSDLEVEQKEESGQLWHIRYPRVDGKGHVIVATTRPETMLGDTAVAVHPDDERYTELVSLEVELPLTGRRIPVIADDYVDMEFGTGCVKITPAHDFNDYEMGQRHGLDMINVLTEGAKISDAAPEAYRDLDRFEARKHVVADLEKLGLLEKIDDHTHTVPRGDRSGAVLEPFLTDQWYVKIQPLADSAIKAAEDGRVRFVPENWANTYFEWMRNIQDWCISRQLWWGHRIPAWYDPDGNAYVGYDEADARKHHGVSDKVELEQDPDVLDTWFSSALWPFSTLGWPEQTDRLKTWYPGNVMVTGFDIIFFWVARMIMTGLKFMGEVPFHEVYIHGLVRDAHGQKMSKSKGNILDPLDLIDGIDLESLVEKRTTGLMQPRMAPAVEKATREEFPNGIKACGTDALRFTFAALATTGRDIRLDPGRIEGYRNFCNKLWNAARYVLMNTEEQAADTRKGDTELDEAARWIQDNLQQTIHTVRENFRLYRFDLAAQALYEFTWNQYCDWYLELSKTSLREGTEAAQRGTRRTLIEVLEQLLRLLHPFIPFITEEIWQRVATVAGVAGDTIMLQPYPGSDEGLRDAAARADIEWLQEVILGVRRIRAEMNIGPRRPLPLLLQAGDETDRDRVTRFGDWLRDQAVLDGIEWVGDDAPESAIALAGTLRLLIPMAGLIDKDAEVARLEKEIGKLVKDLERTENKLSNQNFLNNAPQAVVAKERGKAAEWARKKEELQTQLARIRAL